MEYLLQASLIIALFFICYKLLLKNETFFQQNRWFLLFGIFLALLLPLIVIPIEIPIEPTIGKVSYLPIESLPMQQEMPAANSNFDWLSLGYGIYFLGVVFFLLRFILQFGSLAVLLLKNPKLKDGFYTYVLVTSSIAPFSFFKWIVYNPETMTEDEAQLMLTHEKVHVNQMHSIDIILSQLVCCFFWFNPLMWFYKKSIRQNLEYIADYNTQSTSSDYKTYQTLLLRTSVGNLDVALTTNFYNSLIKERIVMLQKSRSHKKKQWRLLLILPLLTVVLLSMNTKEVYVENTPQQTNEVNEEILNPEIEIIFSKSTTDEQLEQIKKELQSNGVTMKIRELKRNSDGHISSINIEFKTKNGTSNYAVMDEEGISDFSFRMSKDGSFGVGSVKQKEVIIVEGRPNSSDGTKQKIIVNGREIKVDDDDNDIHEIIVEDSNNVKVKVVKGSRAYIVDDIDSDINIYVDSTGKNKWVAKKNFTYVTGYGPDSIDVKKDVKIYTTTGNGFKYKIDGYKKGEDYDYDIEFLDSESGDSPLIIINGEAKDGVILKNLNSKKIENMTVLKDEAAVKIYGDKGKNGVIIVETNESLKDKSKSKWVIGRTEVSNVTYIDDDGDANKNASLAYITKYTPDRVIEQNKQLLEDIGIKVKYSKIRRNKKGEITRIKISLSDGKGSESSASWKNSDGIDGIEYGLWEGNLVARTSQMNK